MELRHIKYFLVVAEELNITKAAEKLMIAQPPLSKQIRDLEEELGTQLFVRKPRGLALTEAGRQYREYALQIVDLVEQSKDEIRKMTGELTGTVNLATVEGYGPHLMAEWVAGFHKISPLVQFNIWNGNSDDVIARVLHGLSELAVIAAPYNSEELEGRFIYSEPWIAIIPAGHPLALAPGGSERGRSEGGGGESVGREPVGRDPDARGSCAVGSVGRKSDERGSDAGTPDTMKSDTGTPDTMKSDTGALCTMKSLTGALGSNAPERGIRGSSDADSADRGRGTTGSSIPGGIPGSSDADGSGMGSNAPEKRIPGGSIPRSKVRVRELAPYELIIPSRGLRRGEIAEWFAESGVKPEMYCSIDHMLNAYELAAHGAGIAIFPASASLYADHEKVCIRELCEPSVRASYLLIRERSHRLSLAAQEFYDYICSGL